MDIFKAHFIHPYTNIPLIIYFNKSEGHVTFETDIEKIKSMYGPLVAELKDSPNICKTHYPVKSFSEVYELLEQIGVDREDLEFIQLYVH